MTNIIIADEDGIRLDTFIAKRLQLPKNQILHLIKNSLVSLNNKTCSKGGIILKKGDQILLSLPQNKKRGPTKNKITDLKIEIIYEDDNILILNKPSNLVIHKAPSVKNPTLVDWLKEKNFSLSTLAGEERYGIVHRLDKNTTGAIIIAKDNHSHTLLSEQLQSKTLGRYYLAVITNPIKEKLTIECNIGRNPKNRLKRTKVDPLSSIPSKYSKSIFIPLLTNEEKKLQVVAIKLFTGRTHQIRVHLESISRHIVGDTTYGYVGNFNGRMLLHAYLLYLTHPITEKKLLFRASVFDDMLEFLEKNFNKAQLDEFLQKPENIPYLF
ncbi:MULTISPECIES: RluA family pseudouridine synthase [unclassified Helicobacter]|uniref:RluA family pseudouridine synthase n=1 Tax=unclassified Helicobacter TaxID=2593540 RepID=UPI000CF1A35B|nr:MULTISPECIES: RluA family pseudouridine synthase [unclassified Helicobacter]